MKITHPYGTFVRFGDSKATPPGSKWGKWTVESRLMYFDAGRDQLVQALRCRCECGRRQIVPQGNIVKGLSKQCIQCARRQMRIKTDEKIKARLGDRFIGRINGKIAYRCARCGGVKRSLPRWVDGCKGCRKCNEGNRLRKKYPVVLDRVAELFGVSEEGVRQTVLRMGWDAAIKHLEKKHGKKLTVKREVAAT